MPDNPARWDDLKAMGFEAPAQLSRGRHPSLPHVQMRKFIAALRARSAVASSALEFLILTNARTDAVLKAQWKEFDLDEAVWMVPLTSLKDRKHRNEPFRVLHSELRESARWRDILVRATRGPWKLSFGLRWREVLVDGISPRSQPPSARFGMIYEKALATAR
jgi:hypothetical protein